MEAAASEPGSPVVTVPMVRVNPETGQGQQGGGQQQRRGSGVEMQSPAIWQNSSALIAAPGSG